MKALKQQEASGIELEKAYRTATKRAAAKALAKGHSVQFLKGREIVKLDPDGEQVVVSTLTKAYARPKASAYRLR